MTAFRIVRRVLAPALAGALLAGCLGEPDVEDRWTRLDMQPETTTPPQPLALGSACSVSVRTSITYRKIITGFAVTELRASTTVTPASVTLGREADRMLMAQSIDRLLQNSVTMGRATRAITGWDHLIQPIDFSFRGVVPTAVVDTSGGPAGPPVGLYLVSYLASGVEVERQGLPDTLIVTPFVSTDMEILPVGIPITVTGLPVP